MSCPAAAHCCVCMMWEWVPPKKTPNFARGLRGMYIQGTHPDFRILAPKNRARIITPSGPRWCFARVLSQTHAPPMDSQANAATPSKAGREVTTGVTELSTPGPEFGTPAMMDVSSPDPAPFAFARQKHPPAISSKPRSSRKVSSLFSSETGDAASSNDTAADAAAVAATAAAAAAKKGLGDTSVGGSLCAVGDQAASPAATSVGDSGGSGFTSPVRASRESGAASSRFTPQRNLGGLFASPLPPPPPPPSHEEEGGVTASPHGLTAAVPLLLHSPKRAESLPAAAAAAEGKRERETAGCGCWSLFYCCVCTLWVSTARRFVEQKWSLDCPRLSLRLDLVCHFSSGECLPCVYTTSRRPHAAHAGIH